MTLREFLQLIRFNNLMIVVITQYFIGYLVLRPGIEEYGLNPYLNHFEFFLLVLCTVLITAGGNIVNDLYDVEIDKINKPDSRIVDNVISIEATYRLYIIIVGIGAIIAIYIAFQLGRLSLFGAYPIAVGLLWIYSRWFKRLPLSGNLIIAVFTSSVPLILLVPEWKNVIAPGFRTSMYLFVILGFSIFAGMMNLLREIVKDMEDYAGDISVGASTLPVVLGKKRVKRILIAMMVLTISVLLSWILIFYSRVGQLNIIYFSVVIISLNFYLLYIISRAKSKSDYYRASTILKIIMLSGLFYLFFM